MKILVTGTRGIPNIMGGVETHCEQLFPRIAAMGYDVTVVRRKSYAADRLTQWNGVRLIDADTPKQKSLEAIIHTFRAINIARKIRADVVHINAVGPALLAPYAKMRGLKVVFTHHGPDYDRAKWGILARTALRLGERMGCMCADHVIVISDVIKQLIARKYRRTRNVHLIYNGVAAPQPCSLPDYFSRLGIQEGKYILAACRFVPEKNLHHLVQACAQINMHGMKLVLAGDSDFDDDYSRALKASARKHGAVLTGFIKGKKLQSLLTHCRCFCLPSSHEGLPIALLEAMSYGVNTLVSAIPANLEVSLPKDAYFPTGNIPALAQKLQNIINAPLSHINYNMDKYDWNKIALQTAKIYESIK